LCQGLPPGGPKAKHERNSERGDPDAAHDRFSEYMGLSADKHERRSDRPERINC
jgi:hypothetical protein